MVFRAIYDWTVVACKRKNLDQSVSENLRNKLIDKLLYRIRYDVISWEDFNTNRKLFENLFKTDELIDIRLNLELGNLFQRSGFIIGNTLDRTKFDPRPLQIIQWKDDFTLVCNRTYGVTRIAYPLQRIERAIFISNKPILWREFICGELSVRNKSSLGEVPVRVTVIQMPNQTFFPNGENKALHTIEVFLSAFKDTLIRLPNPIVVKPQTQYEIKIERLCDRPYYAKYLFDRRKNVGGVEIEFPNEQLEVDNGLVTAFHFNLIL